MPVSDLTNTTWELISSYAMDGGIKYFSVNASFNVSGSIYLNDVLVTDFNSISYSTTDLQLGLTTISIGSNYLQYDDDLAMMQYHGFNKIIITGGTDATNSGLLNFFNGNAIFFNQSSFTPEPEPEPSGLNLTFLGSNQPIKYFVGSLEVSKMFLGSFKIYEKGTAEEATFELSDGKYLYVSNGDYFDAMAIPMISFTIAGNTYQAESGMTRAEWVNSEYNTDGYYISSHSQIVNSTGAWAIGLQGSNGVIIADYNYFTEPAQKDYYDIL